MSRTRIDFASLSKEDKKRLRDLLKSQKADLEAALKATNKELDDLTSPTKAAKKAKKANKRKAKKAE